MRVVVVGATGNVGTSLVQSLAQDPQVTSILGLARRLPDWQADKTAWSAANIVMDNLIDHFRGADAVVHLAWLFQPTHGPVATWSNNVRGSVRVFQTAGQAKVPVLVYASSIGAYSPRVTEQPVDEDWPTDGWPAAAYGREKAYLERVLDAFEQHYNDVRVVRMRPAFIFKRQSASQQRRLFAGPLLPRPLIRHGLVPLVPGPRGLHFQALHASDAAEAYRLAITQPVTGAFNLAAEPVLSMGSIAELLKAKAVNLPPRLVRSALAVGWHARLVPASPDLFDMAMRLPIMDPSRAHRVLGWSPRYSAFDAAREVIEGLREGARAPTPSLAPVGGGR